MIRIRCCVGLIGAWCGLNADTTPLPAQALDSLTAPPPLLIRTSVPTEHAVTPIGSAFDVAMVRWAAQFETDPSATSFPYDSINARVKTRARTWLASLVHSDIRALYLDEAGRVAVVAGEDSLAQHYVAARLSSPALTGADSAYTFQIAVEMFADTVSSAHLTIATNYLARLARLPLAVADEAYYSALVTLARAYDAVGHGDSASVYGLRAFAVLGQMPYRDRWVGFGDASLYLMLANRMMERPDGRTQLQRLDTLLTAATKLPAEGPAADSTLRVMQQFLIGSLQRTLAMSTVLGTRADSLRGTYFWNFSSNASPVHGIPLADGTPRLLFFGDADCCRTQFATFERMHRQLQGPLSTPGRQTPRVYFVTTTHGYWRYLEVTPEEEVHQLHAVYLDSAKLTIPIVLWAGPIRTTPDGGRLPIPSPNLATFHVQGAPYILLIDGNGVIRSLWLPDGRHPFTRADEAHLLERLTMLARESTGNRTTP